MELMKDATTLEKMMLDKAKKKNIPINGSIELLPLCNMNCDMCYVRLSREEMEAQGRLRTVEEWLQVGEEMKEAGVLFLLLTGGEPLLYPQFKELYCKLQEKGMILTINTNGTLIDEEMAKFFGAHKPRRINITLYGADEAAYETLCHYPGGFEKVIRGIRLLKEQGVDVKVGGSLTRANQQDMERLVSLGKELEVPVRIDTYMMPAVRERKKPYDLQSRVNPEKAAQVRVRILREEMGEALFLQYVKKSVFEVEHAVYEAVPRKMTCMAGNCSFTINWQGEMRPCVILSEPSVSVFERGFQKAWEEIVKKTAEIVLNQQCSVCRYQPLCRTCAASALLEEGHYDAVPEYMCRYAKETYRLLKEIFEKEEPSCG